jgi:hypothetical protein
MITTKRRFMSNTDSTAFVTDLGSHKWVNKFNGDSFPVSFVSNEKLKLSKRPIGNPKVINLSSLFVSNKSQIFEDNFVSVESVDNLFTYVVVDPSHEPLFLSTNLFQESFSGFCAFGLKFSSDKFKFSFDLFDGEFVIKNSVGRYCEIINSTIDTECFSFSLNILNIFGESKEEKTPSFFVNSKERFFNVPRKIFDVTSWNFERNFNSTDDCGDGQNISFDGSRTWEIVSHRSSVNDGFSEPMFLFADFEHSACLLDAGNTNLGLKTFGFQSFVNKRMQFNVISNFIFVTKINTDLQTLFENLQSLDKFRCCNNFDFSCRDTFHSNYLEINNTYKVNDYSKRGERWQFLTEINFCVSLPTIL